MTDAEIILLIREIAWQREYIRRYESALERLLGVLKRLRSENEILRKKNGARRNKK